MMQDMPVECGSPLQAQGCMSNAGGVSAEDIASLNTVLSLASGISSGSRSCLFCLLVQSLSPVPAYPLRCVVAVQGILCTDACREVCETPCQRVTCVCPGYLQQTRISLSGAIRCICASSTQTRCAFCVFLESGKALGKCRRASPESLSSYLSASWRGRHACFISSATCCSCCVE